METKANYVATGAFVLLVLAGIIVVALWLAGPELHQKYAVYEARFPGSVSGLEVGAPVQLNGITVGRVGSIRQDPERPDEVAVLLQIRTDVIIRRDSLASLGMQGLTGGRYIEISGGTRQSPKLIAATAPPYPEIASRRSSVDALLENTPEVMQRLNVIADRLAAVLDDRNQRAISDMLANLSHLTSVLDQRAQDLDRILADGGSAMRNLAEAGATLNTLLTRFQDAPANVDRVLASANRALVGATKLVNDLDDVVRTGRPGLQQLTTTMPSRLDALLASADQLTNRLNRLSAELERDPSSVLLGVRQGGYRPK